MERLTNVIINAIERGWLPDAVTRRLVRRLCKQRLAELRRQQSDDTFANSFFKKMTESQVAPVPEKANDQHYELPAEFFELMLGERLKYSCCFFDEPSTKLTQAEEESLQTVCQRADLSEGMNVLELGCGWGSLTLWMLTHFPKTTVTAVSNSSQQRRLILNRAEALGVADRLNVITADMNHFDIDDNSFDRVVSCEMFEHMRNYEVLLRRVSKWLKPTGKLFVHIFCHKDYIYEFETEGASNWMGRYFFTGGIMPNFDVFDNFSTDLQVQDSWIWDGTHYQRTCNAWLELLDERRAAAMKILRRTYGDQQANRWFHRWRLFLIAGAELFGFDRGSQWQIGHYLFQPTGQPAQPSNQSSSQTTATE